MCTDKIVIYREIKTEEENSCAIRKYSKKHRVCYITLYLAVLYCIHIHCKIDPLETIEEIKKTRIINSKGKKISIYLNGIISPFWGFCHDQVGILSNLRFFWHARPIADNKNPQNSSTQSAVNQHTDEPPHKIRRIDVDIKPSQNTDTYIKEYEKTMHILFPSEDEYLSVYTKEQNSFYAFLNHQDMKNYKYKLLAALLVLSERAHVPLIVKKKESRKVLVLSSPNKKKKHFRIPVDADIDSEASVPQNPPYYKLSVPKNAYQVINFFIDSRTNPVILEQNFVQASNTVDFETGRFAFSPGFLIQMFIYEYITSIDDLILLAQELHVLLEQSLDRKISKEENALLNKIFNMCFISRSKQLEDNEEEHIKCIFEFYKKLNTNKSLPFTDQWQLLPTTDPHIYNPNLLELRSLSANALNLAIYKHTPIYCEEDYDYLPKFVNYMDTALLGLFCIFFYDRHKQAYILEKGPKYESKQLLEFFQKYKYMFRRATKAVHDDWNRVVACLSDPSIRYIKPNRNQVDFGLMNMLSIIEHITGVSMPCVEEENIIGELKRILGERDKENLKDKEKLRNKKRDMDEEQTEEAITNKYEQDKKELTELIKPQTEGLKECIVEFFNKLSVNKKLEIEFTNEITADKTVAGKWDIFVDIEIKVGVESHLSMYVNLSIMPCYIDFIIKNNEDRFLNIDRHQMHIAIQNDIRFLDILTSEKHICVFYLFNNLYPTTCFTGVNTIQELEAWIPSMDAKDMVKDCVSIAQLFISRKLDYNRERFAMARNLLFSAYTRKLDKNHYILEVISALFRSIGPEDEFTQKRILSIIKFTNSHIIYPDICVGIDKEKLLAHPGIEYMDMAVILIFLTTEKNPEKLCNVTLNYLNMHESHVKHYFSIIIYNISLEMEHFMIHCLTAEYKSIEYIDKIIDVIERNNFNLYIDFMFYLIESAISDTRFNVNLYIKHLYDKLSVYTEYGNKKRIPEYFNLFGTVVENYLMQNISIFCPNNSPEEDRMFRFVISVYQRDLRLGNIARYTENSYID
ncbi:hypothetical protein NEPAR04_1097 [Nematocida parisii]|nr:hypothetical protein NEPAR08_0959 [Nematocida parisii]KAI5127864.1 hypothetical protein NEPAR03_1144 [Nematocida parisii]KAI5141620.1 hypothetical protein NEPAR04_1097 [Nematocida parisii]